MANTIKRKITIYVDDKEVKGTLKSIEADYKKLERKQKNLTVGSDEYINTTRKMAELKGVINEQRRALNDLSKAWDLSAKRAADYSTVLMGAQSAVQMAAGAYSRVTGAMREYVEEAASMDDAYALVMKTTGLTHDEVLELNEAFKRMDTRTSREQLNRIAHEAGKLGITGVENLKSFVAAADQIGVALGDDLGEGAMVTPGGNGCYGVSGFSGCSGDNGVSGLSGGYGGVRNFRRLLGSWEPEVIIKEHPGQQGMMRRTMPPCHTMWYFLMLAFSRPFTLSRFEKRKSTALILAPVRSAPWSLAYCRLEPKRLAPVRLAS